MLQLKQAAASEAPPSAGRESGKYLSFVLGEGLYAVGILGVKEIIEYGEVTPMPRMPDFVRGAINLRGQVLPVVDLAMRLEQGAAAISERTCIVILEVQLDGRPMDVGITVDAVSRVLDLDEGRLEPAPSLGGQVPTEFIHGMAEHEGRFVIVLEVDRVFTLSDLSTLADLHRGRAA